MAKKKKDPNTRWLDRNGIPIIEKNRDVRNGAYAQYESMSSSPNLGFTVALTREEKGTKK